jgi:TIR domain
MTDGTEPPIKLIVNKRGGLSVHYLEQIPISIGIENRHPAGTMVIESFALRFQSRRSKPEDINADPHTTVVYPGGVLSISPMKLDYCTIQVRPNLLFFGPTNVFDIAVSYRLCGERIGELQSFIGEGWFVLIRPAPQLFGKVFISYKEPQDRVLADLLFGFAADAGFEPYMAPPDVKPGSRVWGSKIPTAIKDSKFMFVIWTTNTSAGSGVKKEIKIARKNVVQIVPLLEKEASDPKLFGGDVEYTRFDAENPMLTFAQVVASRREM